jgi:hypothetical protein
MCIARIRLVIHVSKFLRIFLLNPNFLLAHRKRYSEGMDNGQKTPRGNPNFNFYVKNLRFFVFWTDRQTDRWMDRRTEKLIQCGLGVTYQFLQVKAEICTPVSLQYMVPRVCRKWSIPFSLVEARTEILEILLW